MSDESDYSSENDSDSENSVTIVSNKNKKPLFKPSTLLKTAGINSDHENDDDVSSSSSSSSDDDEITGGADDFGYESEEVEKKKSVVNDEEDEEEEGDVDPEEIPDDSDDEIEIDEDGQAVEQVVKTVNSKAKKPTQLIIDDDDEEEDEYDENYLQKFDAEITKNYIDEFHPECLSHNYDEIEKLSVVIRNTNGIVVDPLHKTIPYLTKYEKARILGQRAKQIETGAKPLVKVPDNIIDSYIIAELELREKKIPFIIRRPIPGGACEYWKLGDLEIIGF
jgi:DNA-directed RNA polymerase I, II, and III subunit RPABC2